MAHPCHLPIEVTPGGLKLSMEYTGTGYSHYGLSGGPVEKIKALNENERGIVCKWPRGEVHDLRMNGGLPPGFQKATLF